MSMLDKKTPQFNPNKTEKLLKRFPSFKKKRMTHGFKRTDFILDEPNVDQEGDCISIESCGETINDKMNNIRSFSKNKMQMVNEDSVMTGLDFDPLYMKTLSKIQSIVQPSGACTDRIYLNTHTCVEAVSL